MKKQKSILIRVTPDMAKSIKEAAKMKNITQSIFIRGAIQKAMPKLCACGNHWNHVGKHFIQTKLPL